MRESWDHRSALVFESPRHLVLERDEVGQGRPVDGKRVVREAVRRVAVTRKLEAVVVDVFMSSISFSSVIETSHDVKSSLACFIDLVSDSKVSA